MWNEKYLQDLKRKRKAARQGGGPARIEKQHAKGKMTARERLDYFFDKGSFQQVGSLIESRFTDFNMGMTECGTWCIPGRTDKKSLSVWEALVLCKEKA